MLHLVHESTLQAEYIGRQSIVENLAATVVEHFVAKGPAVEDCVEILAARTLMQKTRSGFNPTLLDLERFHECKFFSRELAQ